MASMPVPAGVVVVPETPPVRYPSGSYRVLDPQNGRLRGVLIVKWTEAAGERRDVVWRWAGSDVVRRCDQERLRELGDIEPGTWP